MPPPRSSPAVPPKSTRPRAGCPRTTQSPHLLIPHGLGRLVDVHHHGPLEVGYCAGYRVQAVIVRERTAVFGDVGELVEEGVIAVLGKLRPHGGSFRTPPRGAGRTGSRVSMIRTQLDRCFIPPSKLPRLDNGSPENRRSPALSSAPHPSPPVTKREADTGFASGKAENMIA